MKTWQDKVKTWQDKALHRCSLAHWILTGRIPAGWIFAGWTIGEQGQTSRRRFAWSFPNWRFRRSGTRSRAADHREGGQPRQWATDNGCSTSGFRRPLSRSRHNPRKARRFLPGGGSCFAVILAEDRWRQCDDDAESLLR